VGTMGVTSTPSIQIELPADLYERIHAVAVHSDRPVESALVESLALLLGAPSVDWDHPAATLEALPDAQLWVLLNRRLAWPASDRLHELTARGKGAPLSDEEQVELAALIDEADRMTRLRSRALLSGWALEDGRR